MARPYLIAALLILLLSLPFFSYRLGASSLVSWDEAWYAEISRNILKTGNPYQLMFNGARFVDHPPAGFWLMAASQAVLGSTEFAVRLPSVLLSLATLVLVLLTGSKLFHKSVGIAATLGLLSSPWFIYRARSGNLDNILTFFFISSFYFAWKARENTKFILPFCISVAFLVLTKTAAPFTLFPALFFIFLPRPAYSYKRIIVPILLTFLIICTWFGVQYFSYPGYLKKALQIGLPNVTQKSDTLANFLLAKTYLHYGMENWFRPAIIFTAVGLLSFKKRFFSLAAVIIPFLAPFALSPKGQIWHLIPLHPFLILGGCAGLFVIARFVTRSDRVAAAITLGLSLWISVPLLSRNWQRFIAVPVYVSDEEILATKAGTYPHPLIIDDNFLPAAVYYSGKNVVWENTPDFASLLARPDTLIITHDWRANEFADNVPFTTLARDRDKVLILTPHTNSLK